MSYADDGNTDETLEELNRRMTPRTKKVRVVETGEVYLSAAACADALGISPSSVHHVLKCGQKKTAGVTIEYTGEWSK